MKKWLFGLGVIVTLTAAVILVLSFKNRPSPSKPRHVAVFQVVQHPALNAMDQRFRERLAELVGEGVVFEPTMYANGNAEETERIATKLAGGEYSLAFVIGTEQARSLRSKSSKLPIVLGGATDAVGSGLVASWERPGGNITGTSDLAPIGSQIDRLRELVPAASRIAIVYNPAEGNSRVVVALFETECKSRGILPVHRTVTQSNELRSATLSLAGQVDAIYAPTDATVQSAIAALVQAAGEVNLPVFAVDRSAVERGAVFAIGFDYADLGRISAEMAAEILLRGASPETMPLRKAEKLSLYVNIKAADGLKLKIPDTWKKEAELIGGTP